MAARKVVSSEFASCWAKYMIDGKGTTFNKASSEILQKIQKGGADVLTRAVLKNYTSSAPTEVGTPTDSAQTIPASDVKVALGCLNAIRSLQNAAEEEDKVKLPLTWEQLEVFGGNNVAKGKVRACTSIILLISQHNFF